MDLWASFSNSGVYLAVLAGGYLLKRAGLFRVQDARFLSAVIMNITLPAAIVKGFAGVELSGVLLLTFVFSLSLIHISAPRRSFIFSEFFVVSLGE